MDARNPENEKPDGRMLSEKIEDDGNAPTYEETKQGVHEEKKQKEEGEERAEDYESEKVESSTESLLRELADFECRTLADLQRIKKLVCASEGM